METAAPTKFGKYDVVGVLGKGAMGIVYDCRDPVIGRRVAIKTVLKESLDSSEAEGLLGRFKQEAQAAGRLNHPGVVSIYDYGETADVAFIAMEYISGKELKSYFDKGEKFALTDTVRIMSAILEALEHAHQSKVVHRDIKPANIMITDDARVKVADFGVAKIESSLATQIGTRVGTPAYMAPEQHRMMAVDGRADLFSCGVILYQFLTHGARPFTGGSQTIARNILTQTPTPPSQINVELLPVWDQVVKKALAKRADERYQSAREFIDALRRAMGDLPAAPAGQPSGAEDATRGGSRPAAEQAAPGGGAATNTNSGRPERTDLAMESELEFWKEIKDSDHPDDFAAFIDSFPEGRFSHLARRRLDKLNRSSGGSASGETDQTELSAGHTVAKPVPGSTTQSGAGPLESKPQAASDGVAERERAERARQEAEQQAQREAAAARQHEEAEQQARRAAAELAEREARARAQQEAEERKQQALQREAARIASEKELLQQQEQAKREAEAKRERELESHKRKEAEEKALKAAQERKAAEEQRQREALEKREAEAKAKRDALEQERQKKEADARAAKEAQAAKELAERNRREAEKAARETEERTRKEALAKRASEELAKAKADAARVEREAGEKARRGAAAQAEADATVIRQVNVGAAGVRPAEKDAAVPAQFDPDATAIRHVDAYAAPARPGAAAGGDAAARNASAADIDVDIDLTENAPAYYLKDAGSKQTAPSASPATVALKSSGPPAATPVATPGAGADAIRVPQPAAIGVAGGRPAVSATMGTAQDEDDAPNLPEARKKPVFMIAGAAVALVAAGIGWFQFTSTPQPSIPSPGQAGGIEGKPAKDQANTEAQRQPKDASSKAVPDGVAGKSAPLSPVTPGASATADAQKAREAAEERKAEQEAQNRAAEKAAADKVTAEKLAAAKSGAEKAAITKAAADKAAADKLALEKLAAAKSAADKAAADKLAADKAAADKVAADKVAADKAAADKLAADKAAADKAAADKVAADKATADRVASAGGSIADRIAAASSPPELYKRAVALRSEGKASQAVPLLRQASSQGHGPSSRLLAVIFKDGAPDVRADFRQAERFQALAESQGER